MAQVQKKKLHIILYSKTSLVILTIVAIFFIYKVWGIVGKSEEALQNKNIVQSQAKQLEARANELNNEINSLKTNQGVEDKIREKFRVVKDGEGLVVITDQKPEDAQTNTPPTTPTQDDSGGFWGFLKKIF